MGFTFYPDRTARSPDGRYLLEARSPHNGTIRPRDRSGPPADAPGFKLFGFQREFRYRLIDTRARARRVLWERWQEGGEDSPHALHVSDRGWSVLRTQGEWPEVIAIDRRGRETGRVRVVGPMDGDVLPPSEPVWVARHIKHFVGDRYWSLHAWPYFLRWNRADYFVCRTFWGQRLIIDLRRGTIVSDESRDTQSGLLRAMDRAEQRAATDLLRALTKRLPAVRKLLGRERKDPGRKSRRTALRAQLDGAIAAIQIVAAHRLAGCLPLLRKWEPVESLAWSTATHSMTGNWYLHAQWFRSAVHHAIKCLGAEPAGYPVYRFARDYPKKGTIGVPPHAQDRHEKLRLLRPEMTARRVLALVGAPDHVRFGSKLVGDECEWREDWEYDSLRSGHWSTLRITWRDHPRRPWIEKIEQVGPYWLDTDRRVVELACYP